MPAPKKNSRTVYLIATAIAVLFAIIWIYQSANGSAQPISEWSLATVDRGRIVGRVTASGTLSALVTVQVGSQVSGRITQLNVDFNSKVTKGQLIARIDPLLFESALAQARANLGAAQANLARAQVQAKDAQRQARRADELVEQRMVSVSERDTTRANADAAATSVTAAQSGVAQAKASAHQAEVNLNYTRILSPTDGVVISRNVDVGQTVAATLQSPTLFVIAQDLRQMQVNTSVAESDIGKLAPDLPVSFSVDAYPQERFVGKVRQIRNAPTTLQNVVTYDAVIGVENPELKLRPGMTANVSFIYADRENVLRVPNAALRFRPSAEFLQATGGARSERDTASRKLWLLRGGAPQAVTVRTGVSDGSYTEIVEGAIAEGDELITEQREDSAKAKSQQPMRMF